MKSNLEILCVIPARGGSKAIPNKNITMLAGKPLLSYMLNAAQNTKSISRVVVSTDSPKVGNVAKRYGAEVIDRPDDISGDSAHSELALLHALHHLERKEGYSPDLLVFLQCTAPLTLPEDIEGTIEALIREKADTALLLTPFHHFLWKQDLEKNNLTGINHDITPATRTMRQDLDPPFLETGAVYVIKAHKFKNIGYRFFGKIAYHLVSSDRVLEIDDPIDLVVAEALIKNRS